MRRAIAAVVLSLVLAGAAAAGPARPTTPTRTHLAAQPRFIPQFGVVRVALAGLGLGPSRAAAGRERSGERHARPDRRWRPHLVHRRRAGTRVWPRRRSEDDRRRALNRSPPRLPLAAPDRPVQLAGGVRGRARRLVAVRPRARVRQPA